MARDLDRLIDEARRREPPTADDRARVRTGLEHHIAAGSSPSAAASAKTLPLVGASILGVAVVIGIAIAVTQAGTSVEAVGSREPVAHPPAPARSEPPAQKNEPEAQLQSQAPPHAEATAPSRPLTVSRDKPEARSTKRPALVSLTEESRALGRVNQALRAASPAAALAQLDQQDREFAGGALVAERAAARVLALCAAGRTGDAKAKADAFLREHPDSPLRARVLGSCAGSP